MKTAARWRHRYHRLLALGPAAVRRVAPVVSEPPRIIHARLMRVLWHRVDVKVSVVVAAYNSDPEGLARLFSSLDSQSMPRRHFEVVVVDDGSTDDTLRRLRRLARTRSNVVVRSIPNSGWSSRPRNVGVGLARGKYVLFADHDDELFPEALTRAHRYGVDTDADVVNPKEVRTRGWSWGWHEFAENRRPEEPGPRVPLAPMTPHKLYRRAFLDRHHIRFPEGRRVLWEDIHFNVACLAAGARVAVLADYPVYHWVFTDANNSGTFGRDVRELWDNLAQLLDSIDAVLADNRWRRPLLTLQIRGRVLDAMGPRLLNRVPEGRDVARARARVVLEAHGPKLLGSELTPLDRARIDVLRSGDMDAQVALAEFDKGVHAVPRVEAMRWEEGRLVVRASAVVSDGSGNPLSFRRTEGRWTRVLPDRLATLVSPESLDVTDAVEHATFTLSVRGRTSRSTWPVRTDGGVEIVDQGDGTGHLRASGEAWFDLGPTRERQWDDDPVWDFGARIEALGHASHGPLRGGEPAAALVDGRTAIAYRNASGALSLDVSDAVKTIAGSAPPRVEESAVTSWGRGPLRVVALTVPLPDVHVHGTTRLSGRVVLGRSGWLPATIRAEDGRAVLSCRGVLRLGEYELRTLFNGRTGTTGLSLEVGPDATSLFARRGEGARARPV